MAEMTSRERVLKTFRFEETDRAPCDLMESVVWLELAKWCTDVHGLKDKEEMLNFFGADFRWFWAGPQPPEGVNLADPKYSIMSGGSYSDNTMKRPLADVTSIDELHEKHLWRKAEWLNLEPAKAAREQHPDKAIVMLIHQTMLFMDACDFFGIEEALMRLLTGDEVMLEFLKCQHEYAVEAFRYGCRETKGAVDVCWMMDDLATQQTLMMRPDIWREHFKPYIKQQVEAVHENGMYAMFHSCGAIRSILPDLVEIGMDAVLPFQTSADNMEVNSIAEEFGGKIVFYGGMDIQQLLTFGSEEQVRAEVRKNVDAFADCGGHIVANSHHCISNINPENVFTMTDEARRPCRVGGKTA